MTDDERLQAEVTRLDTERHQVEMYKQIQATRRGEFAAANLGMFIDAQLRRVGITVDDGRSTLQFTAREARDLLAFLTRHAEHIQAMAAEVDREQGDARQLEVDRFREQARRNLAGQPTAN